jgi:hypothetical protein
VDGQVMGRMREETLLRRVQWATKDEAINQQPSPIAGRDHD